MAFRLLMIAAFVAAASAYQPTMGASRLARSSVAMSLPRTQLVAPGAIATSLALLAAAEPSLAVEYIAKDPSAVVMSSSPILNLPPGAILFAFIGLYTAATLGTTPLKDGLWGQKPKGDK